MKFDEAMLMLRAGFKSSAAADAAEFAAEFAKTLPKDAIITLSGDLGTGKTNFVKGIAKGLGVAEKVKSPSYNVYSIYTLPDGRKFLHMDAYRLSSPMALEELCLDEVAPSPRVLCVEWPEACRHKAEADYLPRRASLRIALRLAKGAHIFGNLFRNTSMVLGD